MYTVAVRKDRGFSQEIDRYEVHKDVYVYIRQLEVALCRPESKRRMLLAYPSRFPAFQGDDDE